MKRILLSLLTIGAVLSMIGGATMAYFSADATSTGNSFAAGTMVLNIKDPGATPYKIFDVGNLKPGQTVTRYVAVTNDSSAGMDMKWRAWITGGSGSLGNVLAVTVTLHPLDYTSYGTFTGAGYTIAGPTDLVVAPNTTFAALSDSSTTPLVWQSPAEAFRPGWVAVYKLQVRMDPAADNTYSGATYTGNLYFSATQYENPGW